MHLSIEDHSKRRTLCWSLFHGFRIGGIPELWSDLHSSMKIDGHLNLHIAQSVSQQVFKLLMIDSFSSESITDKAEEKRVVFTADELNALRYASGFVLFKLLKRYKHRVHAHKDDGGKHVIELLKSMGVETESMGNDFFEYTRHWIERVDRGGLFKVNDKVFSLFMAIETLVRQLLPQHLRGTDCSKSTRELTLKITEDDNVQFNWCLVSAGSSALTPKEEKDLLYDIIQLWITVRGFSIASTWLETYKQCLKWTVKKSTGLRKHLS